MSYPLLTALSDALGTDFSDSEAERTEATIAAALAECMRRWPGLSIEPKAALGFVASHLVPDESWPSALFQLQLAELCFVSACVAGDTDALAILQKEFLGPLPLRLQGVPNRDDLAQEIHQRVWERLCVPSDGKPPKLSQYSGVGKLSSWLQTVVTREALGILRRRGPERPADEDLLWQLASPDDDQEVALLKETYKEAFRDAFVSALGALSPRDRTILRYHYIDGLSSEQIGKIYRAHRATVARWLFRIRNELMNATFLSLQETVGVSQGAAQSLFAILQSQLDISIIRVLDT